MRVFDAFCFNDELDALEGRLKALYPVVDQFIIVEARSQGMLLRKYDGSNQPKPLYFVENKERFSSYLDKITHVVNPAAFPTKGQHRNLIVDGLKEAGAGSGDVIIMSSVSVPDVSVIQKTLPLARRVPVAVRSQKHKRVDTVIAPIELVWDLSPHTLRTYREFYLRVSDTDEAWVMDFKHTSFGVDLP
jgi:hypothetical protein